MTDATATSRDKRDVNGHLPNEPGYNPFDTVVTNQKHAARRQDEDAAARRAKKWEDKRYPLAVLDGIEQPWARRIAADLSDRNAKRNPVKGEPLVMFKGDEAVRRGATDADLDSLVALSPNEIGELRLEAEAVRLAANMRARDRARRLIAADAGVSPPQPVVLTELLAAPDDALVYRVGDLWPVGGSVLLAAPFKSGKSTMVGNLVRGLVDGDPFLDIFDVERVGRVAVIDTELDVRAIRRWLRDQGIKNTDAVTVVPLRGAVSAFDILDPAIRSSWAQQLAGADVVILDCLRPVLDALGLSEDKDAGKVLVAFDALLAEIGAGEGLVVTHMGHQNGPASERARGDSRLLDWADALWKIVNGREDDDTARPLSYFTARGRDVELPEGLLTFDAATRHLTFTGGSRKGSASVAAMPALMAMVRAAPGELSKRAAESRLCDDHGLTQQDARRTIATAVKNGALVVTEGPRRAQLLSPGVDPFTAPMTSDAASPEGPNHG